MNNLKKYRKEKKFSQNKLAEMVNLNSRSYISQCERGKSRLSLEIGKKLAKILGVDVYDLMGDDVYKKGVEKDIVKVNDRNIQLSASPLEKAFDDFVSGYAYLLESDDKRDDPKDIAIFHLLNVLNEDFHGMTSKDIKSVQKAVVEFIKSQHLNKSALFDFKDELGLNSGDKNKGGNKK